MSWKPIHELVADVKSGKTTPTELVEQSIEAMSKGKEYNAVIKTAKKRALKRAAKIEEKIKKGEEVGRLAGIPYIAKDNFLTKGVETTAASNILKGFRPPFNATSIQNLEDEDAILIAKANLDSFAHGSSTENSDFGVTLNPSNKEYVAGGSSGGSAAAVALDMVPFALGTDTGGSIRLPASFTGTVGIKPTYGLVSRYGVVAMASSTDVIGPITKSVEDNAYVLDVLAGRDKLDATTIERDKSSYFDLEYSLEGKKVGVVKEYLDEGVTDEVKEAMDKSISAFEKLGATVEEVSIKDIGAALAVYYIVMPAEVSSNLSRYDGIRYGYHDEHQGDLNDFYEATRSVGFNDEVKRRILIGTYVLSSGYYDAYYKKAQRVRTVLINEFNKAFENHDFLIGPTSPTTAFKVGENTDDPLKMYLTDIMTVAANLVGNPSVSVPISRHNNLPIGVQVMAPQRHDRDMLAAAKLLETEVNFK